MDETRPTLARKLEGIRHPNVFETVAKYLVGLAEKEILHGHKPFFVKWKSHPVPFKEQFKSEFLAYARHQYPFNLPVDESQVDGVLKWWTTLVGVESAQILPVHKLNS
jgi:hypothetical protein